MADFEGAYVIICPQHNIFIYVESQKGTPQLLIICILSTRCVKVPESAPSRSRSRTSSKASGGSAKGRG